MESAMHGKSHDDVLRNIIAYLKIDDYAKNKNLNWKVSKVSDLISVLKDVYSIEIIKKEQIKKNLLFQGLNFLKDIQHVWKTKNYQNTFFFGDIIMLSKFVL